MKEARIGDCVWIDGRRWSRYRDSIRNFGIVTGIQRKSYIVAIQGHRTVDKIVVAHSMVHDISFLGPVSWRRQRGLGYLLK